MTRIRCRDSHCSSWKNGICAREEIEYDSDAGCLTMEPREDFGEDDDLDWEEDEEEMDEAGLDEDEEGEEEEEEWDDDEY